MTRHTPHQLHDEFPHDAATLHWLKLKDAHFRALADRYHALNRSIHRIEVEVDARSDEFLTRLRKQRLILLDEIALMIEHAEAYCQPDASPSSSIMHAAALFDQADAMPA